MIKNFKVVYQSQLSIFQSKIDACIVALESGAADDLKEALAIWQVTETSTVQHTLLEEQNTLLKQQIRTTKQAANAARDAADAVDQLRR